MAKNETFVHIDFNKQEIQNVSLEKRTSDPTGADLYKGRVWQQGLRVKWYDGVSVQTLLQLSDVNPAEVLTARTITGFNLAANTPTSITIAPLTQIFNIRVFEGVNEVTGGLKITSDNKLESSIALTGLIIQLIGK